MSIEKAFEKLEDTIGILLDEYVRPGVEAENALEEIRDYIKGLERQNETKVCRTCGPNVTASEIGSRGTCRFGCPKCRTELSSMNHSVGPCAICGTQMKPVNCPDCGRKWINK